MTYNSVEIPITSTPSVLPAKGNIKMYKKSDGRIYQLDDQGVESPLVSSGDSSQGTFLEMLNNSSIPLEQGHVVKLDTTQAFSVTTFPQSNPFQPNPFGIVKEGGASGEQVVIAYAGLMEVAMDNGAVAIGNYIYNSSTPGLATSSSGGFVGAIGRALSSKTAGQPGKVTALIAYLPYLG